MIDRRELVTRVLIAAQKARSNFAEALADDHLQLGYLLEPQLWNEDLNVVTVALRVLDAQVIQAQEIYNLLWIAHQCPSVVIVYLLRWSEPLPEASLDLLGLRLVGSRKRGTCDENVGVWYSTWS